MPDLGDFVRPGDTVTWGQAQAEPRGLTRALVAQRHRFARTRLLLGIGAGDTVAPDHADAFDFVSYCGSGANRALAAAGVLELIPFHYATLPRLMVDGPLRVDVVLLQVSPPDEQGRYSLGLANDHLIAALQTARAVLGEVNPEVPWTHGERCLRRDDFAMLVDASEPPLDAARRMPGALETAIGRHVAGFVDDGATLQFGIGSVPGAVLACLGDRRDLGVHSGVLDDGVVDLIEAGAVTNARKSIDRGVTVTGLLMGGSRLRRLAHRNSALQLRGTAYTHDPAVLASLDRLVAINSAVEVDLTGQVNAEVAGGMYVGAVGGIVDFLRGAARSRGGTPIIALPAAVGGRSRIVARLAGPVTVARSDAGVVVTEHGAADLRGVGLRERMERMIGIAGPQFREELAGSIA